jgi:hypothetical protein
MITKIFNSLVLFPEIKFEKKIISGFFMIEILEEKL